MMFIFINEIDFDKISKDKINLVIFDDSIFSNRKISQFFTKSRKLNVSCVFYHIDIFLLIDY